MSLPTGYYRAANGYIYDADGNGPFSLADDGALVEQDDLTLDAFQRLRVSLPSTRFDSQQEYGLDTLRTWVATANGTGRSGIVLDLTKTHILYVAAQWLGVGQVTVGFDINGKLHPAHTFSNANNLTTPYTQTFNLPVRIETHTAGSTTIGRAGYFDAAGGVFLETVSPGAGGTLNFVCCSVQSEGGEDTRGFPFSAFSGAVSVTTRRPIMSIRPAATFQGITNRAHIQLADAWLSAGGNSAIYEIVTGGTLTGASFAALANSCAEVDTAATAIAGGGVTYSGEVAAGGGSVRGLAATSLDFRNPLVLRLIDALAATQLPVTIVATSVSGTATVRAGLNWHELTN